MYTYLPNLTDTIAEIPADGILSRTVFKDEALKVVVFGFDTGQQLSEHTAACPAILHFLQGEADLTLGDDTLAAGVGTWVHMPANLSHSVTAKSPLIMALILLQG